jgi:pimeloyl-ACP methyl ester carboxylesterase/DNA-binding CsgD family transcriptional regulator
MTDEIRFFRTPAGVRVAYRRLGSGPPIVFPAWWFSHQDHLWSHPPARTFFQTLAEHFTVVLYDAPGCGLSDREPPALSLDARVDVLSSLVDHLEWQRFAVFGFSQGGKPAIRYAAERPERVAQLILLSTAAYTPEPPGGAEVWEATKALIRAHWGFGSSTLIEQQAPGADALTREWLVEDARVSIEPETAVAVLEGFGVADVRPFLPRIRAPSLVMHRRDDRSFGFERGREMAAGIANSRFLPLEGSWHMLYQGEEQDVLRAAIAYLDEPTVAARFDEAPEPARPDGLSEREVQVLRLLAAGKSNRAIAEWLVLSPHTVTRHVSNIFDKTGAANRAEAATYAARHGLLE